MEDRLERWMEQGVIVIYDGRLADPLAEEDYPLDAKGVVVGGPHHGHLVTLVSQKCGRCGEYRLEISCECWSFYRNALNGCWDHRREEMKYGDPLPKEFIMATDQTSAKDDLDAFVNLILTEAGYYLVIRNMMGGLGKA